MTLIPRLYGLICSTALLSACGSGLRSADTPTVSYVLHAPTVMPVAGDAVAAPKKLLDYALTVLAPVAQPGLAQDGIALVTADSRLDHYAASRWADSLPRVIAALAVRTLRDSGAIATVNDDSAPFASDFIIRIDVSNFEAQYAGTRADGAQPPVVKVRLECALARRSDRVVLASFVAEANESASENRLNSVIAAFDRATQNALTQLRTGSVQALAAQSKSP